MTIDRAIEWQKEFKVEYDGILKEVDEAIDMAISALQEQKNHGWIPCKDRMPEEYGEYLCVDKYGGFILGMPTYSEREGYFVETDSQFMYDAVAWMPLPEPWKGAGNE